MELTFKLTDGECRDSLALHTAATVGVSPALVHRAKSLQRDFDMIFGSRGTVTPTAGKGFMEADKYFTTNDPTEGWVGAGASTVSSGEENADDVQRPMQSNGLPSSQEQLAIRSVYKIEELIPVLEKATGQPDVVVMRPDQLPPASLEGQSCVYLLLLRTPVRNQT